MRRSSRNGAHVLRPLGPSCNAAGRSGGFLHVHVMWWRRCDGQGDGARRTTVPRPQPHAHCADRHREPAAQRHDRTRLLRARESGQREQPDDPDPIRSLLRQRAARLVPGDGQPRALRSDGHGAGPAQSDGPRARDAVHADRAGHRRANRRRLEPRRGPEPQDLPHAVHDLRRLAARAESARAGGAHLGSGCGSPDRERARQRPARHRIQRGDGPRVVRPGTAWP